MECLKAMLAHSIRTNLQIVVQVATKYHEQLGTDHIRDYGRVSRVIGRKNRVEVFNGRSDMPFAGEILTLRRRTTILTIPACTKRLHGCRKGSAPRWSSVTSRASPTSRRPNDWNARWER